jgi:surface polysaccharide O-acyltransferase-like enzyme
MITRELSDEVKQSFQIVALIATVLVVGIHYKSDVPDGPQVAMSTWNELSQEFLLGGVARVAVPLFAFAAGLFYFLSDDGSIATYRKKLRQRCRTVLLPFLITGSIAMLFWTSMRLLQHKPLELTSGQYISTWLLHPPAEQLWFLRDLMVLVVVAPLIRLLCSQPLIRNTFVGAVAIAWLWNWQFTPVVMGWQVLHLETLLFFSLGCVASAHTMLLERAARLTTPALLVLSFAWLLLVAARVSLRPDFDIWYTSRCGTIDLLLHQTSIGVGCVTVFAISSRLRFAFLRELSGASFFVYLVHEFPLRAIVGRVAERMVEPSLSCWIVAPAVIIGCFATAVVLCRLCPSMFAVITGGRAPTVTLPRFASKRMTPC